LVHVIIHWQWVVNVVGKRLKLVKSPHASLTKSGVAASLIHGSSGAVCGSCPLEQ
jgi:hypothetical protein